MAEDKKTTEVAVVKEKTVYKLEEIPGSIKSVVKSDAFATAVEGFFASRANRERFVQSAVTAITKTPALAECSKGTFFSALMQLAQFGLNPDGRNAHLIPFRNNKRGIMECQLIIDYKGLVTLAYRNPKILDVHACVVREGDVIRKVNGHYIHEDDNPLDTSRKVIGYYTIAHLVGGGLVDDLMSVDDVEKIRARSRAGNSGPWTSDFDEMGKKTVFKRMSKWLPVTPELQAAIAQDDEEYQQEPQFARASRITANELLKGGKGKSDEVIEATAEEVPSDKDASPEDLI